MHSPTFRIARPLITAAILLLSSMNTVLAQETASTPPDKAFRLSLDVPFAGFNFDKLTYENTELKTTGFTAGIGGGHTLSIFTDEISMAPRFEVGLAGKISPNLVLGVRVQASVAPGTFKLSREYSDYAEDNYDSEYKIITAGFGALPFMEVLLSSGKVTPYIMIIGGFRMDMARYSEDDDGDYKYTVTTPRGAVGMGTGAHIFIGQRCSVDVSLTGFFEIGKLVVKEEYTDFGTAEEDETEFDYDHIGFDAAFGISAWI